MTEQSVHSAAQAYQNVADTYVRGRPEYTTESIQALLGALKVTSESKAVDLGAGTGKFTKLILPYCPNVSTVEPIAAMRDKQRAFLRDDHILEGHAESIPFANSSLDCVFVANAFHWFDGPKALKEIHRVLKPGGGLGLIWLNDGVFTSDWGKLINAMLDDYEDGAPQRKTGVWDRAFTETTYFAPLAEEHLPHTRETTPELVLDRIGSLSFIALLPETEKAKLFQKVRDLLNSHPQTTGKTILQIDCVTDIYWTFKRS